MSHAFDLGLFRAQKKVEQRCFEWRPTARWPGNVPYLVDNLWEWRRFCRFERYPTRRHALFAFSRRELAERYAAEHPRDGLKVYRVILHGTFKLCQVPGLLDSKHHPDCKQLPQEFIRFLGERGLIEGRGWPESATLPEKQILGGLWIPGLTADDMRALGQASENIRHLLDAVESTSSYWDDFLFCDEQEPGLTGGAPQFDDGEIFFEPRGGYELVIV